MALFDHLLRSGLQGEERASDIYCIQPVVALARNINCFRCIKKRRVINQDIEFTGCSDNRCNRRIYTLLAGDI